MVSAALLAFGPSSAHGQGSARTAELTGLLDHPDFRVRTQAAFSLGRLDDPSVVPSLIDALNDRHPAVRAAAAMAMGRIGDPRALEPLRRHNDAAGAVRTQVSRAIALIEANTDESGPDWIGSHHYLELGHISNTSRTKRPGLTELIKSLALREMRRVEGVVVADSSKRPPGADQLIKQHHLKGYQTTVSLGRLVRFMGPQKVRVQAEIMLAVLTYPQHVYKMSVTGVGSVTIPRNSFRMQQVPVLQEDALAAALRQAFQSLDRTIQDEVRQTRRSPRASRRTKSRRRRRR
jgi:hypothetical protein